MTLPKTGVLIPLYIYPVKGAWDPLYQAVEKHPSDDFTIVINPASGPGSTTLPDSNWIREITKLNSYKNVQNIGYVACTYGKRPLDDVLQDINHYEQWASGDPELKIQGVFIDEVPSIVDEHNVDYLQSIKEAVKKIFPSESGNIVFNPGTVADRRIMAQANKTIVSEERYHTYVSRQLTKSFTPFSNRDTLACLMHSIPVDLPIDKLKPLVRELRTFVGTIFLTDLSVNYYHDFSSRFETFVDIITET